MWTSIWGWMCRDLGLGMNANIKDECELVYEDECMEIWDEECTTHYNQECETSIHTECQTQGKMISLDKFVQINDS